MAILMEELERMERFDEIGPQATCSPTKSATSCCPCLLGPSTGS